MPGFKTIPPLSDPVVPHVEETSGPKEPRAVSAPMLAAYAPFATVAIGIATLATTWWLHHKSAVEEVHKSHRPKIVVNHLLPPTFTDGGVMLVSLPVLNEGIGSAYDVREYNLADTLPFEDRDTPTPEPDKLTAELEDEPITGRMQEIVANDSSHVTLYFPTGADLRLSEPINHVFRSGFMSVRFRVLLTYRDGDGATHETRVCLATTGTEAAPAFCDTGWEGSS